MASAESVAPSCALYVSGRDRLLLSLREAGILRPGVEPSGEYVAQMNKYDMMHYGDAEPLDLAIQELGITAQSKVLDFGSGYGGPARYLAQRTGCHVTAVDVQRDLGVICTDLTRQCGLTDTVTSVTGNIVEIDVTTALPRYPYDAMVSLLVFLHVEDRPTLYRQVVRALRPGGRVLIEDFYVGPTPLTEEESVTLEAVVGCPPRALPKEAAYRTGLEEAGIRVEVFDDQTAHWREWTQERARAYDARRDAEVAVHGEAMVERMAGFYHAMPRLFAGNLRGVRILGTVVRKND